MKTNAAYIHEFSFLDDINDAVFEATQTIDDIVADYKNSSRQNDLKSFFEKSYNSDTFFMEKEGIFTRIGNAIMKLIKKIGDTISKFMSKFTKKNKEVETDVQIVNRIVNQNPELKSTVCKGIKEEWFTYRDVAKYQNDIIGLSIMLEQQKIDHKKFREKCGEALENFNKSATPLVVAGGTVLSLLAIFPRIVNRCKQNKKGLEDVKDYLNKKTKSAPSPAPAPTQEASNNTLEPEDLSVMVSEVSKAVSVLSEEFNKVVNSQVNLESLLNAFISQYGNGGKNKGNESEG